MHQLVERPRLTGRVGVGFLWFLAVVAGFIAAQSVWPSIADWGLLLIVAAIVVPAALVMTGRNSGSGRRSLAIPLAAAFVFALAALAFGLAGMSAGSVTMAVLAIGTAIVGTILAAMSTTDGPGQEAGSS